MRKVIGVAMPKLKVGDLSTLLAANHMMKSGSKVDLVERLARCRSHGSPGPCPECRHPKLFFEYGSDALCHAHTCTAPTNTADTVTGKTRFFPLHDSNGILAGVGLGAGLAPPPPAVVISAREASQCVVVEYSERCLAVFGNTNAIKGKLESLGGKLSPMLTHNGVKKEG